ncbi:MAG TPA: aminotransferase class V-fold PLP-dependent enzyme [Thermoleophilaceae bacterium]|nr:aminotransferase class V-fold PLP-dependent enzyme [Thermoleophilaceae bacterium]
MPRSQSETPYLDAIRAYAARSPGRLHVPGHKGGPGADPGLVQAIGASALALDIPALTWGIDVGEEPTPFEEAQRLAAEAWGARRTWWLVNGASQGNHAVLLTLAHRGDRVVTQRNAHSSTIDALVMSGLHPTFVAPELDPELHIAHCLTPEALDRALADTPGAVGATVVSPTYFGAVADVAGLAEVAHRYGVPLVVDEAWGAHLPFHDDVPTHALALGADLVISSIHKIVGSLTQSAMIHLGHGDLIEESVVARCVTLIESTSPNSLLFGSLDAARRSAAVHGHELLGETLAALRRARAAVREIPGLDALDERLAGAPGVFDYDPLRLAIDVRGTSVSGFELARLVREQNDVHVELAGDNVLVGVFGMGEDAGDAAERLLNALRQAVDTVSAGPSARAHAAFAPPPPWGELVMAPREAFLGPQEAVPTTEAVGRVAAESLAAYPPGIPNVLPGERLTAETLEYIEQTLTHGGSLRGASDRALRTLRVALNPAAPA